MRKQSSSRSPGFPKKFGHRYDAKYAPLTGPDGNLTGALFVGVEK